MRPTERGKRHSEQRRPSISFTSPFYFPPFFSLLSFPDPLFVLPLPYLFDLFAEKNENQKAGGGIRNTHASQEPERICRAGGRHIHGSHRETQDKSLFSSCCSCQSPSCSLPGSDAQMCQARSRVGGVSPAGFWPQ